MPCLCPSPRKVTSHSATGVGLACWMLLGRYLPKSCKAECRTLLKKFYPTCNVASEQIQGVLCLTALEKGRKHNSTLYFLFIHLRKANNFVPREALWQILKKYGFPSTLVNIIRSLHGGKKVEVMVGGSSTPGIKVANGLRQACTIAPTLFNIFINLVIKQ